MYNEFQAAHLLTLGCDFYEGYHLSERTGHITLERIIYYDFSLPWKTNIINNVSHPRFQLVKEKRYLNKGIYSIYVSKKLHKKANL